MTLPPLLSPSFWFNPTPPSFLTVFDRLILVVVAAFIIVGTAAEVMRSRNTDKLTAKALHRAGVLLIGSGLTALVLYAFQYERVIYLSMRAWWIVWFAWVAIAGWRIYRFMMKEIPLARNERAAQAEFDKWLPKRK